MSPTLTLIVSMKNYNHAQLPPQSNVQLRDNLNASKTNNYVTVQPTLLNVMEITNVFQMTNYNCANQSALEHATIHYSQINVQMDNAEQPLTTVLLNQFVHLNSLYVQILLVSNHQLDVTSIYTITVLMINHSDVTINLAPALLWNVQPEFLAKNQDKFYAQMVLAPIMSYNVKFQINV